MGAVNGQGGQLIPVVVPVVVNPGTVRMHIEYQRPRMREGKNLAMLQEEFIEPSAFLAEIQEGFETAYIFLAGQRQKTAEMLGLFRNAQGRYLVRDTQQYSMLLMTLGHPDLLVRDPDRQPVWDVLEKGMGSGEAAGWLQEQEKQELLRGDVPYFCFHVCSRDLYSGTGEIWKDYFDRPALHCVESRRMAWCHGWGGIVMARLAAAGYVEGSFRAELEEAGTFAKRKADQLLHGRKAFPEGEMVPETSLCLCHGACGNLALLWGIGEKEKSGLMQDRIIGTICRKETDLRQILGLQECDNYGLLGGISGIGYSCLCGPEKILELLCMDP